MRHRRRDWDSIRQETDRTQNPNYDCRYELWITLGPGQGGPWAWCQCSRHFDHDGRRRHDSGGTAAFDASRLSAPPLALRHESRRLTQGGGYRSRRRTRRQARRWRNATRTEDLQTRCLYEGVTRKHRPTLGMPPPRLDWSRRP